MPEGNTQQKNPLIPIAYTSGVISGGVVGIDYAKWLAVHPILGAVIGAIISSIITAILLSILSDEEIKDKLVAFGAFIGAIAGIWTALKTEQSWGSFFGGLIGGAIVGAIGGYLVFIIVILMCLILLLISRGPIALYLRSILNQEEQATEISAALDSVTGYIDLGTNMLGVTCGIIC